MTINPKDVSVAAFHSLLLGAVTPRPIALVSSIDSKGQVNLSPFSFFNCFGANPPILVFSPSRRVRDNTTKHTLQNVLEVPEVVVHIVSYSMVQQTSLSSTEYPKEINEFEEAGFSQVESSVVAPPRVREAAVAMECLVRQVVPTGEGPGAGNLVVCEVMLMHVADDVLGPDGKIDPFKLDAVSRLGGDYYARVQADSIFKVPKPLDKLGIGIDQLPPSIRNSTILSGNDLAQLANIERIPALDLAHPVFSSPRYQAIHSFESVHVLAKELIAENKVMDAWQVLVYSLG